MRAKPIAFRRARKLRAEMSLPEVILWDELRGRRLAGLRFRRQHPMGSYILDFYCPASRVAIEIDGGGHDFEAQVRHDRHRDAWLASQGVRVLRILATNVLDNDSLDGVVSAIAEAAAPSVGFADSSPVNGGAPRRPRGSSPAKRGRGTMRSMVEGAARKAEGAKP